MTTSAMLDTLYAHEPNDALAAKLDLYGRFVGSWELDIDSRTLASAPRRAPGEWHFGWVLEGRAIQDVWIFPARRSRAPGEVQSWHKYGSTFRWYEPAIDAWHITFFDPTRPVEVHQIGRAVGPDIVQIGEDHNGLWRRWRFVEIEARSFRWIGEASWDRGATWTLEMEMRARRAS